MRQVLIILIATMSIGCGFFSPGDDFIERESTEAPYSTSEEGATFYYGGVGNNFDKDFDQLTPEQEDQVRICDIEETTLTNDPPKTIKERSVKFVYDTTKGNFDEVDEYTKFFDDEYTDHLHIQSITLTSISGDNLDFITWFKLYIRAPDLDRKLIAWGGPFPENKQTQLNFDGSIDMKPYVDSGLSFDYEVRGKSPDSNTKIVVEANILRFFNCELQ